MLNTDKVLSDHAIGREVARLAHNMGMGLSTVECKITRVSSFPNDALITIGMVNEPKHVDAPLSHHDFTMSMRDFSDRIIVPMLEALKRSLTRT